ncbi:hypothetical protein FRB97_008534 [Tulasnella sp. 331]|nr:hypothetical protein FRB97_008534 [Tulasnella sp. 331]
MATVAGSATNEPHLLIEDSPVFSLPSDIICIISTTILCGLRKTPRLYYLQVEVLRLVSRHWDLVIRGVACFWSVLHDEQRLKTMKRRLERSGDHSLDIYIRMKFAWQTKLLKEFVEQILPRVQRIRLLDINMIFMSEDVCQLVPQLLAALALTELSVIELVRKRSITMVAIAILQRLRSLTLHGVRAASWDLEPGQTEIHPYSHPNVLGNRLLHVTFLRLPHNAETLLAVFGPLATSIREITVQPVSLDYTADLMGLVTEAEMGTGGSGAA